MTAINTSIKASLVRAYEFDVVETLDEQADTPSGSPEIFKAGSVIEFDVFGVTGRDGEVWDIQFGDGSCAFGVPASIFNVISSV